jgi:hypothetical protein
VPFCFLSSLLLFASWDEQDPRARAECTGASIVSHGLRFLKTWMGGFRQICFHFQISSRAPRDLHDDGEDL